MNHLFIDIETVPDQECPKFLGIPARIKPPANYKKPESIAKWWEDEAPWMIEQERHKLGLHPAHCRIVSICFALNDEPVTICDNMGTEHDLVNGFLQLVANISRQLGSHNLKFVGHNLVGFDLPCIWMAAIRHRLPYSHLPFPHTIKPWDTHTCIDTLHVLSRGDRSGYMLADMCDRLGIESMVPDVDGSMVWELWKANGRMTINKYCADDVQLVRGLFNRIKEWI